MYTRISASFYEHRHGRAQRALHAANRVTPAIHESAIARKDSVSAQTRLPWMLGSSPSMTAL
jgi:hypothetical protein